MNHVSKEDIQFLIQFKQDSSSIESMDEVLEDEKEETLSISNFVHVSSPTLDKSLLKIDDTSLIEPKSKIENMKEVDQISDDEYSIFDQKLLLDSKYPISDTRIYQHHDVLSHWKSSSMSSFTETNLKRVINGNGKDGRFDHTLVDFVLKLFTISLKNNENFVFDSVAFTKFKKYDSKFLENFKKEHIVDDTNFTKQET